MQKLWMRVGVDNFDLEEARKRGIICTNCPGINSTSVAEHTVMLMLNLLRECPQLNQETKEGNWRRLMVTELSGKTVGLLGFGAVARKTAKMLKGFSCRILAYDKFPNEEIAREIGVEMMSLEEVVNLSITQTFTRSINTSLTTFIMVLALYIMGVSSIREFALPLMVGIVCGTYSSVCLTGAMWYEMSRRKEKNGI